MRRRTFGAYEEVPEAEPWDATSYEFFDFNTNNSSGWRSHQQGEVLCPLNVLSGKRKRTQNMYFVPTSGSQGVVTVAKSMFRRKNVSDNTYSDVIIQSKAKGK
eukprot:g34184.t1